MAKSMKFRDYTKFGSHLYPSLLNPKKQGFWQLINRIADINPNLLLIATLIERFGYEKALIEAKKLHELASSINQQKTKLNYSSLSSYSTFSEQDTKTLFNQLPGKIENDTYIFLSRFREIYPENQFWGAFKSVGDSSDIEELIGIIEKSLVNLCDKMSHFSTMCYAIFYEINCDAGITNFIPGGPQRLDLNNLQAKIGTPYWDRIASSLSLFMVSFNNSYEEMTTGIRPEYIDKWSEYFWKMNWKLLEWTPDPHANFSISEFPNEFIQHHISTFGVYINKLMPFLTGLLDDASPNPKKINDQVVLGLLCRIVRLSIQISSFIPNWTSDVAEILLRSIAESYINLKWLLTIGNDQDFIKFYEHGLGNQALLSEHLSTYLEDNGLSEKEVVENNWALSYLKTHRMKEFVSINLGHWNSSSTHKLSKDCHAEDVYNFILAPCSSSTHGSFDSIDRFYLMNNLNPLHGFYKIPNFWSKPNFSLYSIQNSLELCDSAIELVCEHYKSQKPEVNLGMEFFETLMEFEFENRD